MLVNILYIYLKNSASLNKIVNNFIKDLKRKIKRNEKPKTRRANIIFQPK